MRNWAPGSNGQQNSKNSHNIREAILHISHHLHHLLLFVVLLRLPPSCAGTRLACLVFSLARVWRVSFPALLHAFGVSAHATRRTQGLVVVVDDHTVKCFPNTAEDASEDASDCCL